MGGEIVVDRSNFLCCTQNQWKLIFIYTIGLAACVLKLEDALPLDDGDGPVIVV